MPAGDLVLGVALLALALGASALLAWVVLWRWLGDLIGVPRALAFALVLLLGFLAAHLVPGLLGVLGRGSVAACSLLLGVGALVLRRSERTKRSALGEFPGAPASGRLSWALALGALAALAAYVLGWVADSGGVAVLAVDMTTFHLPNVVHWIQSGTFWQDTEFVPHRFFGTYPNTSDVLSLGVMLPFKSDFLVRFVNLPLLALTVGGIYALGRELAAPAATSLLFAVALVATPAVVLFAVDGMADTLMLATFACGVFFLMRERRTGRRTDLVLAGLGLGISFGTKWYALPAVAVAVTAWVMAALLERSSPRRLLTDGATLAALVGAAGGFWLLRNWVEVGNPVFPVKVAIAGQTIFDAPRDLVRERTGFSISHYFDNPGVWRRQLWPNLLSIMTWVSVLLWVLLPVSAGRAWAQFRQQLEESRTGSSCAQARSVLVCVAIATGIAAIYTVTPYTAQGEDGNPILAAANARYVTPALAVCAALGAWVSGCGGRVRTVLEWAAFVLFLDAIRRDPHVSAGALALGLAAVAGILAIGRVVRSWWRASLSWRSPRVLAAMGAAAAVVVAGLFLQERRFADGRYAEAAATDRWIGANAPSGHRVGVVGDGFVVHPMFGARFGNLVEYVGPMVRGELRPYKDPFAFQAAVRRGRYDLVLVQDFGYLDKGLPRRQERWLRALGYRQVASGHEGVVGAQEVRLYRAR